MDMDLKDVIKLLEEKIRAETQKENISSSVLRSLTELLETVQAKSCGTVAEFNSFNSFARTYPQAQPVRAYPQPPPMERMLEEAIGQINRPKDSLSSLSSTILDLARMGEFFPDACMLKDRVYKMMQRRIEDMEKSEEECKDENLHTELPGGCENRI